ncbi:MAG: Calx-beta domain-containing protein, partial [Ilumatobacteraceae bacterium]
MAATLLASVVGSVVVGVGGSTPPAAHAAGTPIEVLDGFCSLQDAIAAVNAKNTVGNCFNDPLDPTKVIHISTGSGSGVWRQQSFPGVFTPFDLAQGPVIGGGATAYPSITTDVIIEGVDPNPVIDDRLSIMMDPGPILAGGTTRAFHVDTSGSLTLRNINLLGFGVAGVGSTLDVEGGAIYAQGPVVLDHVTVAGNSATGKQPPRFGTRSPGDAQGGAIYSTSSVTATGSVFTDNRVTGSPARPASGFEWVEVANQLYRFSRDPNRNPSGARGGNALGADVALGANGTFVATDTNFLSSRAFAGSGTAGEIDSGSDNYGGGRMMDGSDGRDGDNVACNDADDGNNGSDGNNGTNGGAAGDATGVIFGGASVTLEHSSIVDALAVGGGAGKAGPPGIGGDGGNGGSNGTPAFPGERATAVATIESTQHVTLVNTTIVASKAIVSADTTSPTLEAARVRALTQVGAAGQGGTGTGTNGSDGNPGTTTASTMFSNDRSTAAGSAVALLSSANSLLSMSSSTIADVNLEFPSAADGRADVIIKWITAASGSPAAGDGIMGSIAWSPGSDPLPCPNLGSGGYNVRRSCPAQGGSAPGEVFTFESPLVQYPVPMGDVLRPPLYPTDAPYRMFVLPLKTGSVGIDVGAPSVSGTGCPAVGQATNSIFDDARHQPRENRCDAGAYEVDSTPAALEVIAPDSIWVRDKFGGLLVQVIIGPGTTLGADARLTLSSNVANTRFTGPLEFDTLTFSMPLDPLEPIPLYLPFEIFADTGATLGPVTITATLDPGGAGAGTFVTATDTSVIHEDSRLEVTALQPSEVDTCSILDLTYVASASGRSQPADRNITVWPLQEVWNRPGAGGPTQQYVEHVLIGDDTTIMYNNGQLVERRAQVDLGGGLFEPFTFDPVMVRPMTEFLYLSFSGVPFDGTDYVMLPGQTLQVATGLRNNNPTSPCGLINGVSSVRVIGLGADKQLLDAGEQAGGVEIEPNTGASDWRSWGGPLTAPMEPGNYTFWWELEIPGLDQPLIIPQQFVVQAVGVGVTPKTLESVEGDSGSSTREFEIALDTAANSEVSVDWTTADDTATAGTDYEAASGTVTFAPGETSKTVT